MKKMLSIVLCAATASAFAEGEPTVAELGTVGVTAITTSLSNAIVAVSYDDLAGGSGIVVSNFVKTTNLTVGDQLAVFTNGVYSTWKLEQVGGETGPKYWAKNEKEFTVGSDGKLQEGTGSAASEVTQAVGTGIWLVRQNPKDDKGDILPFYIYGRPVSDPKSTTVAGKWTLVGNPTQTQVRIGTVEGDVKVTGVSEGDQLVVPVQPAGNLRRYHFHVGTGWQRKNSNGTAWDVESPLLEPGLGCWLQTANPATINW